MDDSGDRGGSSSGDGSETRQRKSHYQRHTAEQIQRLEGYIFMDDSGDRGGSSGGDGSETRKRKSHYQRHTAEQIQRLEGAFKECTHPDDDMRMQLSQELGLSLQQIKFWFQNKRTQLKVQQEKTDNSVLRAENEKFRSENIAIIEALKNAVCASCRGQDQFDGDSYLKEQKLHKENAHLREELKRLENIVVKYMGRPLPQLRQGQPIQLSSLDSSMASFGNHGMTGPSTPNLDLLSGSSSTFLE